MASILIIDDEALVLETLNEALRAYGHEVQTTPHPDDGLKLATQCDFDVVICDMFMPGADGFDVLQSIRKNKPGQKIIMASGGGAFGMLDVLDVARNIGADAAYSKTDGLEILQQTIDTVLGPSRPMAHPQTAA